jgi:hypothetical protein
VKKHLKFFNIFHYKATLCFLSGVAVSGCAPVVDVYGIYFPPWLVAAAIGLSLSYILVRILMKFEMSRSIGQSGLFFVSLAVIFSYLGWWLLFRIP